MTLWCGSGGFQWGSGGVPAGSGRFRQRINSFSWSLCLLRKKTYLVQVPQSSSSWSLPMLVHIRGTCAHASVLGAYVHICTSYEVHSTYLVVLCTYVHVHVYASGFFACWESLPSQHVRAAASGRERVRVCASIFGHFTPPWFSLPLHMYMYIVHTCTCTCCTLHILERAIRYTRVHVRRPGFDRSNLIKQYEDPFLVASPSIDRSTHRPTRGPRIPKCSGRITHSIF